MMTAASDSASASADTLNPSACAPRARASSISGSPESCGAESYASTRQAGVSLSASASGRQVVIGAARSLSWPALVWIRIAAPALAPAQYGSSARPAPVDLPPHSAARRAAALWRAAQAERSAAADRARNQQNSGLRPGQKRERCAAGAQHARAPVEQSERQRAQLPLGRLNRRIARRELDNERCHHSHSLRIAHPHNARFSRCAVPVNPCIARELHAPVPDAPVNDQKTGFHIELLCIGVQWKRRARNRARPVDKICRMHKKNLL